MVIKYETAAADMAHNVAGLHRQNIDIYQGAT